MCNIKRHEPPRPTFFGRTWLLNEDGSRGPLLIYPDEEQPDEPFVVIRRQSFGAQRTSEAQQAWAKSINYCMRHCDRVHPVGTHGGAM